MRPGPGKVRLAAMTECTPLEPWDGAPFHGAKAAVLIGDRLLVTLRDSRPGLPWAGHWDFPGGGRDGDESPEATLAREIDEELGLTLSDAPVLFRRRYPSFTHPGATSWFFVLRFAPAAARDILFGDEGQAWMLIDPARYAGLTGAIPALADRLADWTATQDRLHL